MRCADHWRALWEICHVMWGSLESIVGRLLSHGPDPGHVGGNLDDAGQEEVQVHVAAEAR